MHDRETVAAGSVRRGGRNAEHRAAPEAPRELWNRIDAGIRSLVEPEQYETWFRRAGLVSVDEHVVRIAVQNGFTRDWLLRYYRGAIESAVQSVLGEARSVEFVVDPESCVEPAGEADEDEGEPAPATYAPERPPPELAGRPTRVSVAGDVGLNLHYLFDRFVVGPCNRFAHAAAVGVSESPGTAYNPFFLHGNVGLGKTHLMQALCHARLDRDPSVSILYLSCETFINHFISALENGDLQKFRNKYRNVDLLVVDDIHLLANKERTQEEFFHTFNTLYNAGKQIVLSSDSPPKDIPTLQGRLVSRFKWGLVTEVEAPCFETRVAILRRKSRDRGRELPEDVARLLAERIESNVRELEGAVTKILGYAALSGDAVTPELARRCLREVFTERRQVPSMEDIMRVVTEQFGVKLSDLQSRKRTNAIAWPRQVGMYLSRKITRMSLEEIGGFFGGRDHSTVLYAVQKLERLCAEDDSFRAQIADLEARLHRSLGA